MVLYLGGRCDAVPAYGSHGDDWKGQVNAQLRKAARILGGSCPGRGHRELGLEHGNGEGEAGMSMSHIVWFLAGVLAFWAYQRFVKTA